MKEKLKFFHILFVAMVVIFSSCQINEPMMPSWDISLNLPIAKKNYTLMELIEKNNSDLNYYKGGENINLLYYSKENMLDAINVKDKLKVDGFSQSSTELIGPININPDSVSASVGFEWIGAAVTPGQQTPIPPIADQQVKVNLAQMNMFNSVKFSSGSIDLSVSNQFASLVTLTISNMTLKNSATGEVVARYTGAISILPGETRVIKNITLSTSVTVRNLLSFECSISTSGTSNPVTIPAYSFGVKAKLINPVVVEAFAKIPVQEPLVIENTIAIDAASAQPTKFQNVKIDNGLINIRLSNNLDVDADVNIIIYNMRSSQGSLFNQTKSIARKQQNFSFLSNLSLKGYTFESLNGQPTNQVKYKISITTKATADNRVINSNDGVAGSIDFSDLTLSEFSGQLKPTSITAERSSVSLDLKDIQNKLSFKEINLKNPSIQLVLNTTAQFEMGISGRIEAKNNVGEQAVLELNSTTLNSTIISSANNVLQLNKEKLSEFFKKFTKMPDSLIIYTGGTLNPGYKTISIKSTDQITGKSFFELPLEFGISDATFEDSVDVELSSDERDKIKQFNSIETTMNVRNGLPASISLTGELYDEKNVFLDFFPHKYSDQENVISISGAPADGSGNVILKPEQTIKVKVLKSEAEKISKAKYMKIKIKLSTTANGNTPVRFKTTDDIQINAFGSVNYRVKNDKER